MGLQVGTKWMDIAFTCILLMNLAGLVTGKLVWIGATTNFQLYENTTVGTIIGSLRLDSTIVGKPEIKSTNSYVNVNQTQSGGNYVEVNVILNVPLDYEATRMLICVFQGSSNGSDSITRTVSIFVGDVNEPPILQNKPYSVTVMENIIKNTIVYSYISAIDNDFNNRVNYTLTPSSQTKDLDKFRIDLNNGSLILTGNLSFEEVTFYQYTVTAMDNLGLTDSADVFITIGDVQNAPPYFTGEPFQVKINESLHIIPDFIRVKASDGDRGIPNEVSFNISSDACKGLFTIDEKSGWVSSISAVDREADVFKDSGTCTLEIMATEDDQHPQDNGIASTATTSVIITVMDINDNVPTFSASSYIVTVEENTQPGVIINFNTPISITDEDQGTNALFEVNVVKLEDYFEVTPQKIQSTGEIWIRVKNSTILDYEKHHNLTIEIEANDTTEVTHRRNASVTIIISNINDNSPVFTNSSFSGSIFENSTSGTSVIMITATDADENDNHNNYGIVTYTLEGSDSSFVIDPTSGLIKVGNKILDREKKDTYSLTVSAKDGGDSKASVPVEIKILDSNDKTPTFLTNSYQTSINEGSYNLIPPITVHATDDDDPNTNNSKISYKISKTPQELLTNPFTINNGEIALLSPAPDYENLTLHFPDGTFQIEVTATDWGIPPLKSTALINVTILDINNKAPVFYSSYYSGSVMEKSDAGVIVAIYNNNVTATDGDGTSPNNDFYYVIQSGSRDKLQINTTTGVISVGVGASLDRETTDKDGFTLIVLAIDKGSPPLTGSTTVSITVLDVNDSPPEIKPTSGVFSVNESAHVGTQIAAFSAFDGDEKFNLIFSLLYEDSHAYDEKERPTNASLIKEWLEIDAVEGIITVKSKMDREQVEQMILKVVVADKNAFNGTQEATATVTISLQDVNDNPPIITSSGSELQLFVSEGTKLDTEVTTLTATDADKGQIITFSLPDTNSSFRITGQDKLLLNKLLDRETEPQLRFGVVATDDGTPKMSSNITVIINVQDINDNDPYFLINQTTFSVYENSDNTTLVAIMKATDIDAGDNGNVTFQFKDESPFRIDPITGNIYVSGPINREDKEIYSLTVIAADNPLLEATRRTLQAIIIEVQDLNDNKPEFVSSIGYQGTISETASVGDVVQMTPGQISATDKDAGNNSVITFLLQDSSDNYFRINPTSGAVMVNFNITNLLPDKYSYVVNATDNGSPAQWTVTNLTITVLDENNNFPVFVSVGPISAISECEASSVKVGHFNATDADTNKDTNGKVQYYLDSSTANNHSQYFYLNQDTGDLSTKSINNNQYMFADEELEELEITVIARDCGVPQQLSTTVTVKIKVLDTNDNPPEFDSAVKTNFTVSEGLMDIKIGSFKASDKDKDSVLTYQLDTDDLWNDYFNIINDPVEGGVIYVKKPLDREEISQIKVKIIVSDKLSNATSAKCPDQKPDFDGYSTTLNINVFIEDINDNPPVFQEKSMSVGFLSSTKFGEKIISLLSHVKDNDTAPNSVHKFYQVGEVQADVNIQKTWDKNIQLNPVIVDINGTVSTNHKFIEDAYGYFILQILANDSAGNDTTSLKIFIVGESQVIHMTFWCTEDQLRQIQNNVIKDLSEPDYNFVADNILPAYNQDGSVDKSKSVLVAHALDVNGNILDGKTLVDYLDASPRSAGIRNEYKIYSTQAGDQIGKSAEDNTEKKNLYILIGIIAVIAITFVITLYLLIHTIRRFKRKLKAATLETHTMDPLKQDIFPSLDNDNIKANNPIFMRHDLDLNESKFLDKYDHNGDDTLSNSSENSLDQNTLNSPNMRGNVKSGIDEQEITLDLYETDEKDPGVSDVYEDLHSQYLRYDDNHSKSGETRERSVDGSPNFDPNMRVRNFESTDI